MGVAFSVALSSCVSDQSYREQTSSRRGGYSLDKPAGREQGRYQEGARRVEDPSKPKPMDYQAPEESGNANPESNPEDPAGSPAAGSASTQTAPPPPVSQMPTGPAEDPAPTPAPTTPKQPAYGTPVIGKRGYVYPPGVEAKPENMVDVKDFAPGQKVRDPRTGNIFLVP